MSDKPDDFGEVSDVEHAIRSLRQEMSIMNERLEDLSKRVDALERQKRWTLAQAMAFLLWIGFFLAPLAAVGILIYYMAFG